MVLGCFTRLAFFPMKSPRKFALITLAVLATVVVLQNFSQTQLTVLFWSGEMPLVILLLLVLALGMGIRYLLGWKRPPRQKGEGKAAAEPERAGKYQ